MPFCPPALCACAIFPDVNNNRWLYKRIENLIEDSARFCRPTDMPPWVCVMSTTSVTTNIEIMNLPHSWLLHLWMLWGCSCSCIAPLNWPSLYSVPGWIHLLQINKLKISSYNYKNIKLNSPFTAILIIIPNFAIIFPLASSFGPLMCLTFDHLLWPAQKAVLSRSVRTGPVQHGGDSPHEPDKETRRTGAVPTSRGGRWVRRALSRVSPSMPFTPTQPQL